MKFVYSIIEQGVYDTDNLIYDANEAIYRAVVQFENIAVLDAFTLEYYGEL